MNQPYDNPSSPEIDLIHRIFFISTDELESTILVAHALMESALKVMHQLNGESSEENPDSQETAGWNEYAGKVTQILDDFGNNLQKIINQKIGREVLEEILINFKRKITPLIERR